jgi:hypothetical protein
MGVTLFLDVVRSHILKRKHTLDVQIAGTGDEVAFVGIFAGELEADQVAAVV